MPMRVLWKWLNILNFLKNLIKIGYLKETVVFFVSDHGNNMAGIYNIFQFEDYVLEKILGT